MDLARTVADTLIRRNLTLVGIAVGIALLGLCYDAVLLFRGGAVLVAGVWLFLVAAALAAPHRDHRNSEFGLALASARRRRPMPPEAGRELSRLMQERLLAHADWVAALAFGMWIIGFVATWLEG
ncbi:hypothetical protein ACE7GA_14005 [Roseomonas sp. CCTCC AB2023176]|uniref:hypothetical protein n=1 Tax=Roseomonas sp. CCTCC AB2023176 TaxID=3342640 RepID=UPI0035D8C151